MRDDFSAAVKEQLAKRVGARCSNPRCRQPTSGPHTSPDKSVSVGVAAHITAAAPGGPRYDAAMPSHQRASIENGIWLCQTCSKLIDADTTRYSTALLLAWKSESEAAALHALKAPPFLGSTSPPDPSHPPRADKDPAASFFFRPTEDRLVVEVFKLEPLSTKGGLHIPDEVREPSQEGIVVSVGEDVRRINIGNRVFWGKYSGTDFRFEDRRYSILRESDVLGVLGQPKPATSLAGGRWELS